MLERAFLSRLEEGLALARAGVVEREDSIGERIGIGLQRAGRADSRHKTGVQCRIGCDGIAEKDHWEHLLWQRVTAEVGHDRDGKQQRRK